jgi:hypothetical protein
VGCAADVVALQSAAERFPQHLDLVMQLQAQGSLLLFHVHGSLLVCTAGGMVCAGLLLYYVQHGLDKVVVCSFVRGRSLLPWSVWWQTGRAVQLHASRFKLSQCVAVSEARFRRVVTTYLRTS